MNVTENLALEPLTDYSKYKALCEEILLKEKSYSSLKDLQNQKKYFYNYEKLKNKEYAQSFGDLIDEKKHTLELVDIKGRFMGQ